LNKQNIIAASTREASSGGNLLGCSSAEYYYKRKRSQFPPIVYQKSRDWQMSGKPPFPPILV